jgi:transposase
MAFITKRKKGDKIYYYLARAFRKNGAPTHEIILSLGTAEDILASYNQRQKPEIETELENVNEKPSNAHVYQFGTVSALLDIARRLDIEGIIDEYAPKREQGLSVGSYMVLAAINRAVCPVSKNSFYEWFKETVLSRSFPGADKNSLSCQNFWNHMIELDQETLTAIEDKITERIVKNYNISTKSLLFDNTNFLTYIDTENPALIPQRGHSKEKRKDLKIIGLSLMASSDFNIPLFHETYPGNKHDSKQIISIIHKLKSRFSFINSNQRDNMTLVFDKGNNSAEFIELLENDSSVKFHYVGSLRLNQCSEVLTLSKEQYVPLTTENLNDTTVFRFQKNIYGRKLTVIITDNPKLREEQLNAIQANILKCKERLNALQYKLKQRETNKIKKGKKPTHESVTNNIKTILSAEHMKNLFIYQIIDTQGHIVFKYRFDTNKYHQLVNMHLGKSIIFTNRHNWSNEQIVSTYRSQYHVEETFKQLKNTKYLSFRPVRHFTDRTIRVHAFYCVLALSLCSLLKLEMEKIGYSMSINTLLDQFSKAQQSVHIFIKSIDTNPKIDSAITDAPVAVKEYISEYGLNKYELNFTSV